MQVIIAQLVAPPLNLLPLSAQSVDTARLVQVKCLLAGLATTIPQQERKHLLTVFCALQAHTVLAQFLLELTLLHQSVEIPELLVSVLPDSIVYQEA